MQVTLRLATSKPGSEGCRDVLQKRWQDAQWHIPEDKRGRMKTIVEDKFKIALSMKLVPRLVLKL